MEISKSIQLFERAKKVIPGGVNSPVRAFKSVGGNPIFVKSAKGAYIFDENDNRYIDYISSWGPMILGHAHPNVVEAIRSISPHIYVLADLQPHECQTRRIEFKRPSCAIPLAFHLSLSMRLCDSMESTRKIGKNSGDLD